MRSEIEKTLENLVSNDNSIGRPIITGFNYYPICLKVDFSTVISLSNIHSSQAYLRSVMDDLGKMGYPNQSVSVSTRDKRGYFQWRPDFFIRNEDGSLEENLRIRNKETGDYLDLARISQRTLPGEEFSEEEIAKLIAENKGYEINTCASSEEDIRRLAVEFLVKSSAKLFDEHGDIREETDEERLRRAPWPNSSYVPVLIIGGRVSSLVGLPGFQKACIFRFQGDIGEYLFIVNHQRETLSRSREYDTLQSIGFREEPCLCNHRFIMQYVDDC